MKILAIETSCDDTAVSIIEAEGGLDNPQFSVLSQLISSQIEIHQEFGGVVPNLARREHSKKIVPMVKQALKEAKLLNEKPASVLNSGVAKEIKPADAKGYGEVKEILAREENLIEEVIDLTKNFAVPEIDAIAVTEGPGLEPALWVGINTTQALGTIWQKPVMPVNHMMGHLVSPLLQNKKVNWPALALLVSGGHTELVLAKNWNEIKKIGQTRDDAAGEAFDKVARLLGLPYPGGPEISKLAQRAEGSGEFELPRPMITSNDFDFSFSGLKTSVLYTVKDKNLSEDQINSLAYEFQEAATDVLTTKTKKAIEKFTPQTLILAGGVSANKRLQEKFTNLANETGTELLLPDKFLSTDNATMIAMAGYLKLLQGNPGQEEINAQGNLSL